MMSSLQLNIIKILDVITTTSFESERGIIGMEGVDSGDETPES